MRTSVHARRSSGRLLLALLLTLALLPISGLVGVPNAQAAYIARFSTTTSGAITFTGNTLGLSKQANANAPGTVDGIGTFITTNTTLRDGTYPQGTTADWHQNGSAAVLSLPPGSTVLRAELIWSGSYSYGGEDVSALLDTPVRLTTPAGATTPVAPDPATANTLGTRGPNGSCASDPENRPPAVVPCFYVRSADVTALVRSAGVGAYTVGGVPGTQADTPDFQDTRNNAGWTLAVVYGNPALPTRNLTLFVGAEVTNATASTPVGVSGFCTPPVGPVAGRLFVSATEGDASISGDQMQFGPTTAALTPLNGPNNPVGNFFASQLNDDNGALDTSGTFGNRNQNAAAGTNVNGGRQGWDVTSVDVSSHLTNAQTSAVAQGTSTGDQYVINALGTQIDVGAPAFPTNVKTVDKAQAVVGDTLTYTIRVDNRAGTANASNVLFKDTPPAGTSFIPGSLTIDGVAQPGANPAVGVNLGTVTMGNQPTSVKFVSFKVRVDFRPSSGRIDNSASWTYQYVSCANQPALSGGITTNQVTTQLLLPDLAADKAAALVTDADGNGAPSAGDTLAYQVTIRNTGPVAATGVTYSDVPDENTTLVPGSVQTSQGTVTKGNAAGDKSIAVNIGAMPAGASVTVSYRVTINKPLPPTVREIVNQGVVTSNEVPPIPTNDPRTPAPGDPTRVQIPPSPLLTADKTAALVADADNSGGTSAGDTLEYAVTIKNIGNAPATGVIYTDTPDANTTLVPGSVQTSQGTVTGGNTGTPPITVDIGSIPVNASVTVSYRVTINKPLPPAVQVIVNQGVVTSNELPPIPTNDPRTPPDGDPTRVPVSPPPQLTADKADILVVDANNTGKPGAGDILLYLITIANRGNGAAQSVNFADTPDPNTTLVAGSVQTSQGKVTKGNTAGDTSVAVSVGTIAPGASVTISFRVRLNDSLSSSRIANQGTVTGGNTPPVPTNDPDTPAPGDPTVTIIPPGELTAVVLTSFTAAREGGAVVVRWATAAELNTWGFYLLRSADGRRDHAARVTPELIPGQGRGQGGASYQWADTSATPGATYYYWLQEVEVNGTIAEYGPAATIAPAGQYRVLVPIAIR